MYRGRVIFASSHSRSTDVSCLLFRRAVPNHIFVNRNEMPRLHDDEALMEKLRKDPEAISGVKYKT